MTRTEAAHSVRERWERLGIGTPEEFPHVFSSDVDNMLEELSSTQNILDVGGVPHSQELMPVAAAEKNAGEMDSPTQSQEAAYREHNQVPASQIRSAEILEVADMATGNAPVKDSPLVGSNSGVSTSARVDAPEILDRHGDDRFADNILRALDGLPQNGDDLEEEAAAEEGALIDASGYLDPVYERNGR